MTMHQLIVWDHSHGIPFEVKQGEEIGCYGWSAVVCDVHVVG
jgi:hypothetical protein